MSNVWFESNKIKLEGIKRFLIEESYKTDSSPDALNPMYLNNMFDGAILEILRLQKEVDRLMAETNRLVKEAKTPQKDPKSAKTDG